MTALLAFMALGALLEALGIGLVVPFIGLIAKPDLSLLPGPLQGIYLSLGLTTLSRALAWTGIILLAFNIFKNVFLAVLFKVQFHFLFEKQSQLACRLFTGYMNQPYAAHLLRDSAEIQRIINTDVFLVFDYVVIPTLTMVTEASVVVAIMAVLLTSAPAMSLTALLLLGALGVAFFLKLRLRLDSIGREQLHHVEYMMRWVQQGLGGFKEAKVLRRESFFVDHYAAHRSAYAEGAEFLQVAGLLPRLVIETLSIGAILSVVTFMLAGGSQVQSVLPTLAMFVAAAFRLMPSANRIISAVTAIRANLPRIDLICRDLQAADSAAPKDPIDQPKGSRLGFIECIELRGLTFRYAPEAGPALDGLSLSIPKGSSVALIGTSGGGKSTAIDILLGLLTPQSGEVLVDGVDIRSDISAWQKKIGYIPQPVYLYDDTIRRNVAFGLPDEEIDDGEVWRALQTAQLESHIRSLPEQLDTQVGERGVRLSGGQRQRIGIARVLYRDPEILVLDEATSGLDNETEAEIARAISAFSGSKTLVIVAHKLSTVRNCDRLYLLKRGKVVASGPYAELLKSSADFKALAAAE